MHLAEKILLMQPLTFGGDYPVCPGGALNTKPNVWVDLYPVDIDLEACRHVGKLSSLGESFHAERFTKRDQEVAVYVQRLPIKVTVGHHVEKPLPFRLEAVGVQRAGPQGVCDEGFRAVMLDSFGDFAILGSP